MFSSLIKYSRRQASLKCMPIRLSSSKDDNSGRQAANQKLQELLTKIASEVKETEQKKVENAHPVKKATEKRPTHQIKLNKIPDRLTKKLVSAVQKVADELGGDKKLTESELLQVILKNKPPEKPGNLKEVISKMKVEKEETRAEVVRELISQKTREKTPKLVSSKGVRDSRRTLKKKEIADVEKIDLFGGKRLQIFSDFSDQSNILQTWAKLEERDLKLLVTHPPSNIYEEMILWTRQGKLWKFPIDNEQGLEEEKAVDFSDHVFLERHLEPWCPERGPIRHFMDLVLVGLSKNPYITVQAKIDHILWFRDYFQSKRKLLEAVGAIEVTDKLKLEDGKVAN